MSMWGAALLANTFGYIKPQSAPYGRRPGRPPGPGRLRYA